MRRFFALALLLVATRAQGVPLAEVEVSVHHGSPIDTTLSDSSQANAGTVAREVAPPAGSLGCCDLTASATATTGSAVSAGSLAQIDVIGDGTGSASLYSYARAISVVPWLIESNILPVGTEISVDINLALDGQMRVDFMSRDQDPSLGFPSPGTYEGRLFLATVEQSVLLEISQLSNGEVSNFFSMSATLDVEEGFLVDVEDASYFTDISFLGATNASSTDPAALAYAFHVNDAVQEVPFPDVVFRVGEVYDVRLWMQSETTVIGNADSLELALTTDFLNTATYALESPDPVSFRALPVPEPATGLLLGVGLTGLAATARWRTSQQRGHRIEARANPPQSS